MLAISLWGVYTVFSVASNALTNYGTVLEMSVAGTGTAGRFYRSMGSMVGLAGSFLTGIFLFFARYLLAREPEVSVLGHWRRSFSLGRAYFIEIFIFLFWLMVPLILGIIAAAFIAVLFVLKGNGTYGVAGLLLLIGCLIFYSPYLTMAEVLFSDTVMKEAEKEEKKRERKKMAVKSGGGWYAVDMVTGEAKKGTVKKNEDEPWE